MLLSIFIKSKNRTDLVPNFPDKLLEQKIDFQITDANSTVTTLNYTPSSGKRSNQLHIRRMISTNLGKQQITTRPFYFIL